MKKNTADWDTLFWTGPKKRAGLQLLENFFQFNDLAVTKKRLNDIIRYAIKKDGFIAEDPSVLFQFHQSMRSFVRAGYLLMLKKKKHRFSRLPESSVPVMFGLLSEQEYLDPLLVFSQAYKEYTIKEFDYFMSGMVYLSMGISDHIPEKNIINPYIHLMKMLDAAHLILQRRSEKKTAGNHPEKKGDVYIKVRSFG